MDLRIGVKATAVRAANGELTVELEDGSRPAATSCSRRSAAAPTPATSGSTLSASSRASRVPVDDRMAANDWLYAIGDANGRVLLTHMGKYQARVAADVILGKDVRTVNDDARSPRVIFTNPQVARPATRRLRLAGRVDVRAVEVSTQGNAGAVLRPRRRARHHPARARRRSRRDRGRHLHRPRVQDFRIAPRSP